MRRRSFLSRASKYVASTFCGTTALATPSSHRGSRSPRNPCYVHNQAGMCLRHIPAQHCILGISDLERDAVKREASELLPSHALSWVDYLSKDFPRRLTEIQRSFYISTCQVTVGSFATFVRDTGYITEGELSGLGSVGLDLNTGVPAYRPDHNWGETRGTPNWIVENVKSETGFKQSARHPVVCVSWNDAANFCNWLSLKDGVPPKEWCFRARPGRQLQIEMEPIDGYGDASGYRLPTEDEWECACRAGTISRYHNGADDEDCLRFLANVPDKSLKHVWSLQGQAQPPWAKPWDDGFPFTAPVCCFRPNGYCLYDMHGNVGEWCARNLDTADDHRISYPSDVPPGTPEWPDYSDPIDDFYPVRGGVWLDPPYGLRSGDRGTHLRHPVVSAADIGFRVVRTA